MRTILLGVLSALLVSSAAIAGSGTVNYNSSGSTPFGTITDAGSNNYSAVGIVDGSAAANKAAVNASGQLNITGPVTNAGTFATQSAITAASGSVASGAFAAGSMAAGAQVDLLTMRGAAAAGTAPSYMLLGGAIYNSTPITVTNTQSAALQSDANGFLKVNIAAGAAAGGTSSNFGSAFPTPGTAIGLTNGTNMIGWSATTNYGTGPGAIAVPAVNAAVTNAVAVTNTGTFAVQATLQASATTAIGKVDPNTIGAWGLAASTQNGTTPTNGHLVMGQFNTSPTTVTNGNISPLQMDAAGNLLVNIKAGGAGTSSAFGSAFPANGTAIGLTNGTNMVAWSATSNYGTAPSAIAVPAVNASVTNSVAVTAVSGAFNSGSLAAGAMVDLLTMRGGITSTAAPSNSLIGGAIYNSSPITVTNTQSAALQSDVNGNLKVNVTNTNANGSAVSASSSPVVIASDQAAVAVKAASGSIASGAVASGAYTSGSIGSGAMVDLGAIADAAATVGSTGSVSAKLRLMTTQLGTINTTLGTPLQAGGTVGFSGQYPVGATPLTASATGTTGATTATLAGTSGKTTYLCTMSVRANATANTNVVDTITGVITGTLSRSLWVPANTAGLGVDEMVYNPCIPASTTNTAIAVVSGAPGTGGVVSVNATGYQL